MWLDILLLAPIAWGGYSGWKNGVLDDIVSALHFIIAFLLSFKILSIIFHLLEAYIFKFNNTVNFAAFLFAASVASAFVLLNTLGKYLKTEIEYDFPGAWDNISGSIFGVLKYVLIMSFVIWFLQAFGQFNGAAGSYLHSPLEHVSYKLAGVKTQKELCDAMFRF